MTDTATPEPSPPAHRADDEGTVYEPPGSLRGAVVSGVKWKLSSQIVREGSRLAVAVLLARLLTPEQWGIAGMALAVAAVLQISTDPVVGYALVQRNRITESDRSTAFWVSLGIGLTTVVAGIALSGLVADFFGEPQVQELFVAVCIGFAIASLGSVPAALLTRDLDYKGLELRQIVGSLVGASVAISLALAGAGPWAIVANSLAASTASTILLWIVTPWRPRFIFSRESARDIAGFGTSALGWQFLLYLQLSVDKLLVGRYLGSAAIGNYAFAFNIMFTPILNVAYPLTGVLFPVLATVQQDEERLLAAWLRAKRLVVSIMAPAFLTLFVVGPDLIPVVFGSRWDNAIPVLQLLCVAGVAHSLSTFNSTLLIARGRVRTLLLLALAFTTTTTLGVAVGLEWGIVGVAAGYTIAQWAFVLPDALVTTRVGSAPLSRTLRAPFPSLPFALGAAGAGLAARWALIELGAPAGLRLVVAGIIMLATYLSLIWFGSRSLRAEAEGALEQLRKRRSGRA